MTNRFELPAKRTDNESRIKLNEHFPLKNTDDALTLKICFYIIDNKYIIGVN